MTAVEGNQSSHPLARADLDINEVPDGLVVYDGVTDRVHYLNLTASVVFVGCTGDQSEAAIAALVQETFGLEQAPTDQVVECLTSLRDQGLLVQDS